VLMNSTDARLVVPYFSKSKESRMYCGKVIVIFGMNSSCFYNPYAFFLFLFTFSQRLNLAYGLAALEREEIESARRTFSCSTSTNDIHNKVLGKLHFPFASLRILFSKGIHILTT